MLQINKNLHKNIISVTRYVKDSLGLHSVTIVDKDYNVFDWNLSGKDFMKLKKFVDVTDVIMF
jgi:hypothetical protein